jgi:CRISPR-associated protein Cmr2
VEYLFEVAIGPVQAFIASARRSRDLQFGSWLLSELSKAAAREIAITEGPEKLIFPAPKDLNALASGSSLNVANKIVAHIQSDSQQLGERVQEAVFAELHKIRDEAYKDLWKYLTSYNKECAIAQVDDLIEFQWVAVPLEISHYQTDRRLLEAIMSSRKNTRDFSPASWGSNQPKSSITGQLESVIEEHLYPAAGEKPEEKRRKSLKLYQQYKASPGERLSGVDLLKRHGTTAFKSGFPSTSHMAALSFIQRLKKDQVRQDKEAQRLWDSYIQKVEGLSGNKNDKVSPEHLPDWYTPLPIMGKCEGSMLFPERLVDLIDTPDSKAMEEAKKALEKFFQRIESLLSDAARPDPYYAILLADGDSMGTVIDNQDTPDKHRNLSQALDAFAGSVEDIVKSYQGALIYAGGDDVLAFLPLHTVVQCARELATRYRQELTPFKNKDGDSSTLSVGIAIIHHLALLRDALDIARRSEQAAKQVKGKNALAIIVSKRSGDEYTIAGQWSKPEDQDHPGIDARLDQLITFCSKDEIPDGTAYELRDAVQRLTVSKNDADFARMQVILTYEVQRILDRKLRVPRGKLTKERADHIEQTLRLWLGLQKQFSSEGSEQTQLTRPAITIGELINEIITAQILADARKLAKLEQEGTLS